MPCPDLDLDTVFEVLANSVRRLGLYALVDASDGVLNFQGLLEDVVTLDAAIHQRPVTRDRLLELGRDLYEWHLPVLADVGVIDLDARHETIRYVRTPLLDFWLDTVRDYEIVK